MIREFLVLFVKINLGIFSIEMNSDFKNRKSDKFTNLDGIISWAFVITRCSVMDATKRKSVFPV